MGSEKWRDEIFGMFKTLGLDKEKAKSLVENMERAVEQARSADKGGSN
jgi:hypothetical protein